ncbi:Asialoglycoprotein receptor 2 [Labeo rohita]|uniref:Asialoglycoprotein receptor 2 n=1 Tax=Labeo rohita TaxID=84645 RepID=A0ABQ8LR51_LABRO|nr:Asialoglycoprotein receptor 2 [Labeo rohita]
MWTKVRLIVFAASLLFALEDVSVSMQLSAQKTNGTNNTGCALCAIRWIHFGGKCYYFSTVKMNWTQSHDYCVTVGGHLVIINSKAEQDFVTSNVKVTSWIGLNDLDSEGHWVWVNNQPLNNSVEFWMKQNNKISEPDNWTKVHPDGEDCASLGHPHGETDYWTDAYCFEEKGFTHNFMTSYLYKNETLCDFLILNNLKQDSSHIRHLFCQAHEMDLIYENSSFILSTVASADKSSQCKDNSTEKEQEREVTSPKWTKVLLIVLGFSLILALGGLCALGMFYNKKLTDFKSLNNQHIMISTKLSAQEINSTIMKKEFNDLTTRYNTLRKWLSFYDAQSCNLSVDGWIACRGKLYLFNSDKLNWSNSRDVCVLKGADLVTITNQTEQNFLVSKIKETHWIGLNDLETEGHWVWNDSLCDFLILNNLKQDSSHIRHFCQAHEMDLVYENSSFILSTVASAEKPSQCKGNSTKEQEIMARELEELTANYTTVIERLSFYEVKVSKTEELTSNYTSIRERLSFYEAFTVKSLNCNVSLTDFHRKLYFFSSNKMNWSSSRAFCVSKGADLVTITSQTEQRFLASKITEWHWLGVNDLETEGHWVWVNNQTLSETGIQFWYKRTSEKSEPDNWKEDDHNGENCAIVKNDVNYLDSWFDVSCNYEMKFICEKKY